MEYEIYNNGLEGIVKYGKFTKENFYLTKKQNSDPGIVKVPRRKRVSQPDSVSDARSIKPYVRKALDQLGMSDTEVKSSIYPQDGLMVGDILLEVQSTGMFLSGYRLRYGRIPPEGLLGYAYERSGKIAKVKEGPLEIVVSITGHELGHLFTPNIGYFDKENYPLTPLEFDEEAKAYAFEHAWCEAIQTFDTNLAKEIFFDLVCRKSGPTHQKAHKAVKSLVLSGYDPLELYYDIANKRVNNHKQLRAPA